MMLAIRFLYIFFIEEIPLYSQFFEIFFIMNRCLQFFHGKQCTGWTGEKAMGAGVTRGRETNSGAINMILKRRNMGLDYILGSGDKEERTD